MVLCINGDPAALGEATSADTGCTSKQWGKTHEQQTLEWNSTFQKYNLMSTDAPHCEALWMYSHPFTRCPVKRTPIRKRHNAVSRALVLQVTAPAGRALVFKNAMHNCVRFSRKHCLNGAKCKLFGLVLYFYQYIMRKSFQVWCGSAEGSFSKNYNRVVFSVCWRDQ